MRGIRARVLSERGATLVEVSISLTLILTVILAIAEFGLAFRDWTSASNSAREGARTGSIYGNDPGADLEALRAIEKTLAISTDLAGLEMVHIFDAETGTGNVYYYEPATSCGWNPCPDPDQSGYSTPTWPPSSRDVTAPFTDLLGVEVVYTHTWATGLFADTSLLTGRADYVIEPQEF
jgi:hypothetical protein